MLDAAVTTAEPAAAFRSFTFLLDKNGQLNYNIDITELIHASAGSDHLIAARGQSPVGVSSEPSPSGRHKGGLPEDLRQVFCEQNFPEGRRGPRAVEVGQGGVDRGLLIRPGSCPERLGLGRAVYGNCAR